MVFTYLATGKRSQTIIQLENEIRILEAKNEVTLTEVRFNEDRASAGLTQ